MPLREKLEESVYSVLTSCVIYIFGPSVAFKIFNTDIVGYLLGDTSTLSVSTLFSGLCLAFTHGLLF